MTIIVDSRQQAGKHDTKHHQLETLGAKLMVSKLPIGDYARIDDMSTVVDTKKDVCELMGNLGKQHKRFSAECQKAMENGIKLIILVEEMPLKGDVRYWQSPVWKSTTPRHRRGEKICKMSPISAYKTMWTMSQKYGVRFEFCEPKDAGRRVFEMLGGRKDEI